MKDMRVIFMGTPEFAVESLKVLVENDINVVAVITAPDKPQGRGKKLGESDVKRFAMARNLKILQPTNLKSLEFLDTLKKLKPDLQIVVAFRMLPESVWGLPKYGTFNVHASLLPQYRGAAPINWAIINGEKITGVTTFKLQHKIDTGEILLQKSVAIGPDDDVGILYEKLKNEGAKLALETVKSIGTSSLKMTPQAESRDLKEAPKIFKKDCEINWSDTAQNIKNFVRGLSPYPGAWMKLNGEVLKVFEVQVSTSHGKTECGIIDTDKKKYLSVTCIDKKILITDLQLQGKKRMKVEDFLRGYSWPEAVN